MRSFCWILHIFHLNVQKSEVWIGIFNVKAWKTTKHKLHKIWRSLKFFQKFQENEHTPAQMIGTTNLIIYI